MYYDYDTEEGFEEKDSDIDSKLYELENRKMKIKEPPYSEIFSDDASKTLYELLAIERERSRLLETKFWHESVRAAKTSSDLNYVRENSKYDFSRMLYFFLLVGFLYSCARHGIPSSLLSCIGVTILSPAYALFTVIPFSIISAQGGIFGEHRNISALLFYIITAIIIFIAN